MSRLGELEAAIVRALWERDHPAGVPELHENLRPEQCVTAPGLQRALKNLHRAGLLARRRSCGTYVYWPTVSRAELRDLLISQVLGTARADHRYTLTCVKRIID
ncbi:BlaI/MecI/CopY family transcriptional regulator [Nonomuraea rubra]